MLVLNYIIKGEDGRTLDAFQGLEGVAMKKATELGGVYRTVDNETYNKIQEQLNN